MDRPGFHWSLGGSARSTQCQLAGLCKAGRCRNSHRHEKECRRPGREAALWRRAPQRKLERATRRPTKGLKQELRKDNLSGPEQGLATGRAHAKPTCKHWHCKQKLGPGHERKARPQSSTDKSKRKNWHDPSPRAGQAVAQMDAAAGPKAPRTGQRAASLAGREAAAERKPGTQKARACQVKGQRASWKCGATSCRRGASSCGAWQGGGWLAPPRVLLGVGAGGPGVAAADAVTQQVPTVLGEVARRHSLPLLPRSRHQVFSLQSGRDGVATQVQSDANGLHALAGSPPDYVNKPSRTLEQDLSQNGLRIPGFAGWPVQGFWTCSFCWRV